jgi:hypothetical protein
MGPGFDTSPFGWVTTSRYWMSGLVAGGAVMMPYIAINLVLGRLVKHFRAPQWWRLWVLCAVPLLIAVPAIVMTANDPVLPLANAAQVTAVTLIGLAPALMLGAVAAERPLDYLVLMIDGLGLACLLVSLASFEDYSQWIAEGSTGFVLFHLVIVASGTLLLLITTSFYVRWRRTGMPSTAVWLVAGLDSAYLLLPLAHHLFLSTDEGSWTDPGYFRYISDSDNYFARNPLFQIGVWMAVALIALGITRLRVRLSRRRTPARAKVRRGVAG